ncbi:MAG TPA: hypothetical protein VMM12_00755 [Longimicrobiales bacterium]|nr:hypothetical protein [Longimicrobiales bacterium]
MFDSLIQSLPEAWREGAVFLAGLVTWIPPWQERVLGMVLAPGGSWLAVAGSWTLLGLPAVLLVVAMWTTMLSVYTLPFRSGRGTYLRTVAFSWWDMGRGIAVYWAGVARFFLLAAGLLWSGLRYAVVVLLRVARSLFTTPAAALDWTAKRYFKPGVPWLAFVLILGWAALEAAIFTFTLRPTMYEVLYDITGAPPSTILLSGVLYAFLFLLIAGSFACIQVLTDAIQNRRPKEVVQMLFVEFFVMFFEVVFLYRELIDAITPWIAQQTGGQVRLGLVSTLVLASFGWMGIRAMTWFLFGRYGTPALMAILSRQTLNMPAQQGAPATAAAFGWWKEMVDDLKREQAWLRGQADRLAEALVLPMLQLLAAALNFVLVLVSSRPAFELPFSSMEEAMARFPTPGGRRAPAESKASGRLVPETAREG